MGRYLVVTLVVAVYIALGFFLHLTTIEYQLLGTPLLLVFQLGIQRQPLRTLWVRSGPPPRLNGAFFTLWLLFSLVPAYELVRAVERGDRANAAFAAAAIVGAFGLTYALRAMRASTVVQLGLCVLTVGAIVMLPLFLSRVLHLNFRIGRGQPAGIRRPTIRTSLRVGARTFLMMPIGFMVEEVFFRGALDTYIHRGDKGTGWLSAIFVSALWGLWHLPGQAIPAGRLLSTAVNLVVPQIIVGVPLSYWWRKSGNLAVSNTAHALLDAIRDVLATFA